jgi:hypothetical protein
MKIQRIKKHNKESFLSNIIVDFNGCWLWTGFVINTGYGRISYQNKRWLTHRLSYFLHYNVHPGKKDVCHKCDTPRCINPNHLFLGDASVNVKDSMNKGRFKRADYSKKCRKGHIRSSTNTRIRVNKFNQKTKRCLDCLEVWNKNFGYKKKKKS